MLKKSVLNSRVLSEWLSRFNLLFSLNYLLYFISFSKVSNCFFKRNEMNLWARRMSEKNFENFSYSYNSLKLLFKFSLWVLTIDIRTLPRLLSMIILIPPLILLIFSCSRVKAASISEETFSSFLSEMIHFCLILFIRFSYFSLMDIGICLFIIKWSGSFNYELKWLLWNILFFIQTHRQEILRHYDVCLSNPIFWKIITFSMIKFIWCFFFLRFEE